MKINKGVTMKKGFTLIEALIVISIIGIIAAIIIPTYFLSIDKNKLAKLGLKYSGDICMDAIYYNPDNKYIVEINDDKTKIKRTIGRITVPLTVFESLRIDKQREVIEYSPSKPMPDDAIVTPISNSVDTIIINGIKYVRQINE